MSNYASATVHCPELMLVLTHFLYVIFHYGTMCQLLPFYHVAYRLLEAP